MTTEASRQAIRGVRTLFQGVVAGLSDAELLRRFADRDESAGAAFEVLIDRHGPAVWAVCRRTLAEPADALDAFQATFLVLVRKAGAIKVADTVGPWLHGVSLKIARRARSNALRRKARERTNAGPLDQATTEDPPADDLRALLDLELARLPSRYRAPLTLCYLEGLTQEEAAARLSCPVGTVRSRLARGRGLLHDRLVRRGLAPSLVAGALALEAAPVSAALPRSVIASTLAMALVRSTNGTAAQLAAEVGRSAVAANLGRSVAVVVVLIAWAVVIAMVAWNRENNDAPLPVLTVQEIAVKVNESKQSYGTGLIEVEFEDESINRKAKRALERPFPHPPGFPEDPPKVATIEGVKPTYEKGPGHFRYASDGRRWKGALDDFIADFPKNPDGTYTRRQWVSGHDGTINYRGDHYFQTITLAEPEQEAEDLKPSSLFWHRARYRTKSILDEVLEAEADVSQVTVDGFRCYIVKTAPDAIGRAREAVISPRQSYLPLATIETDGKEVTTSVRLLDLRKLPDGRWYPGRLIVEERFATVDHDQFLLEKRRETRVIKFEPDHAFGPGDFAIQIPTNARITDRRTGFSSINDPWWPEMRDLLAKEMDWPRADMAPMDALKSPLPDLEGREAPPISAGRWLRGGPVSWASLRGKVVLLVFPTPGDSSIVPSLRWLRKSYKAENFEVVEVMPGTVNGDWSARYFDEYDVDHPVLWDAPLDKEFGKTCAAFGVREFPAAYLIDPRGRVRSIAEGNWSVAIVVQLRAAGSKTAKPLAKPENLGFGFRVTRLREALVDWSGKAPSTGRIVGQLVDDKGKPVVGALVRCRLVATVLAAWNNPTTIAHPGQTEATTGPDGSFVLAKLCKGNYDLEFVAPGRAVTHRNAVVEASLSESDLKLVAVQGDTITGIVRDEAGRPIPGAFAKLSFRHVDAGFERTNTFPFEFGHSAVTDQAGRFRFDRLAEGRFTLRITAPGKIAESRDEVPSGTSDLEFKLKSTVP